MEPAGGSCLMRSVGRYRSFERTVTAILGCRIPALPDTVAMVTNNDPWKGNPPQGTVVYGADIVSANRSWFSGIVDRYRTDITDADTFLLDAPLIIQSAHDLKKIGHIVNGPLLIDGAHVGMKWRDTGTVIVRGDLQITGEVEIRDIDFIVAGEIKLLDEADLSGSDLFTQSRIFIGDRSRFEGNALAMHSITVYGNASIRGKSSLIAGSAEGQQGSGDSSKYSILLSEECEVDAVCIALGGRGSIKSDLESSLSGILWAEQTVCHRGRMKGLICAGRLVDCDDPGQSSPDIDSGGTSGSGVAGEKCNGMSGELEPLDEIASYSLPFFLGRLSIVRWEE